MIASTDEAFGLRLGRASAQYRVDYGWCTGVVGTRLLFTPEARVTGLALDRVPAARLVQRIEGLGLHFPVVLLGAEHVFLATDEAYDLPRGVDVVPLDALALPPSRTPRGNSRWAVPPRRGADLVPSPGTLLALLGRRAAD
ncbi:hypothetical protein [Umezawaea beigongshangensis]|uniref:hypothetical protein n=1 Tax=Umezawaea beigongshangensis TaxID=2780383 RepID=UPI0018F13456|nr:hypothetical protein [Umezawaea beigongshangensis]